jgi:putative transposase
VVLGEYFATLAGMRKPYPTDLSDAEWNYIQPHLPLPKGHGRPRIHDLREILNAIFYVLKSGCQWRLLPHDFPRWPTVYHYFRKWRIDGTWERVNRTIRHRLRVRLRRDPQPSAGVVDSQGRSKAPRWAVKSAVTTVARRSKDVSATSLWTPRA